MLCFQQTRTALLKTGANAASQDKIVFIIPLFKKYIFICNKIEIFGVVLPAKFWPAQIQLQNMCLLDLTFTFVHYYVTIV